MQNTYRAVQATEPGVLELVERPLTEPGSGFVRIRVEACGVCHSDALTVEKAFPWLTFPRVPGHEVVGRIDAVGPGVERWSVGQRVGVGYLGGQCNECDSCRRGDFVHCQSQPMTGVQVDGGYAEYMFAKPSGLVAIPDELDAVEAAPLLCAGLTTFNALRKSKARPGDTVAVLGVGGLGHLAVQFARHMGFRVVAIARGEEKREFSSQLGAHHYVDSRAEDPAEALQKLGGAKAIIATASSSKAMTSLIEGLAAHGELIILGIDAEPVAVHTVPMIVGERSVSGALTGSSIDNQDTLSFSVLQGIRSIVETFPLEKAPEAYRRMMANEARYRIVLVTGQ